MLLWCATPESVTKLDQSELQPHERKRMSDYYHDRQAHESIQAYLKLKLKQEKCESLFAQVQ